MLVSWDGPWATLLTQREGISQDRKLQVLEFASSDPKEAQAQRHAMKTDCPDFILSSGCYQLCGLGLCGLIVPQFVHL